MIRKPVAKKCVLLCSSYSVPYPVLTSQRESEACRNTLYAPAIPDSGRGFTQCQSAIMTYDRNSSFVSPHLHNLPVISADQAARVDMPRERTPVPDGMHVLNTRASINAYRACCCRPGTQDELRKIRSQSALFRRSTGWTCKDSELRTLGLPVRRPSAVTVRPDVWNRFHRRFLRSCGFG